VGCTNDSLLIFFKKGLSHSCQFLQFVWLIFRQINAVHCFYRGAFQTQIQAQIDTSPAMFPSSDVLAAPGRAPEIFFERAVAIEPQGPLGQFWNARAIESIDGVSCNVWRREINKIE
jgi:hypothetical protein